MKTLVAEPKSHREATATSGCCTPLVARDMSAGDAREAASLFRALADPNRVRILNLLANSEDPVCVCDITDHVRLAQATVSFHLKKLVDSGLLAREQRGTWGFYSLRRDVLSRLGDVLRMEGGER